MSAAVCRAVIQDNLGGLPGSRRYEMPETMAEVVKEVVEREEEETEQFDIWSLIQIDKEKAPPPPLSYVHSLVRRSSSLMSQKSLETCTENLGSETGSDGFSSCDEWDSCFVRSFSSESETGDEVPEAEEVETDLEEETALERQGKKKLSLVNYHCSIGRRAPQRFFPPPLPSITSRDGPCLKMLSHRCNGRLVMEAVPVPPRNYLHATRHGGRLLLSFVDTSTRTTSELGEEEEKAKTEEQQEEKEVVVSAEEEDVVVEEEVEVVDRGTIVEVKVSTQPQQVSGVTAAKVHRSSLVINKFVVGSPLTSFGEPDPETENGSPPNPAPSVPLQSGKRPTTTAAAAAVAASSISTTSSTTEGFHYNYLDHHHDSRWGSLPLAAAAAADAKLLFTSRRRSREELLRDMRRCSELRRPLFIFEQPSYWIATSS
ncbi:hypothetical protein HPP92_002189 [Vanilla planifolia]|uniref:FAF domain-containing protein n=1 Tax=Vanilla planifolia TaxID=51239 RepID=A0A835VHP1_VANPL|nr:hypothetical protein HPP92_002189 [Vanilla planifolia]